MLYYFIDKWIDRMCTEVSDLGKELLNLRVKLGLSLREAKEKTGLSHNYIRKLELGFDPSTKTPIEPSVETLKKISLGYGISFDKLMQLANYSSSIEKNEVIATKVPIYKTLHDMKSKKETNDFRLYKQELVSKNAILVEVSNPSLSKFNSNSLLLEPYEDSFKGELVLLTTDSKIIIGHINLFNDKELQLKPIDSESTVTIKKD